MSEQQSAQTRLLYIAASAALLVVIIAHFCAVRMGQWQGDEYDYLARLRDQGFGFVWHRLATVSPRPFSECLIFFYALAVTALHRPLIGVFLAGCWAILLCGCVAGFVLHAQGRLVPRLFLALCLIGFFLLGHPIADLLYWPISTAAYAPTLAALCFLTALCLDDIVATARGKTLAMLALLIAAGSSEVGAFVVFAFTSLMLTLQLWQSAGTRKLAWLLVPFCLCLAVFGQDLIVGQVTVAPTLPTPEGHHLLQSLRASVPQMLREMGAVIPTEDGWGQENSGSLLWGVPLRLLCLAGFSLIVPRCFGTVSRPLVAILIVSLLAGMFATILAAYYKFGFLCCQRHEAMRQCLMILVLLASACLVPRNLALSPRFGLLCIALAMVPMIVWRMPNLLAAWHSKAASESSLATSWANASATGNVMVFTQQPATLLTRGWNFPPGTYSAAPPPPRDVEKLLRYFRKPVLIIK